MWMISFVVVALFMTSCQEEAVFEPDFAENATMRTNLEAHNSTVAEIVTGIIYYKDGSELEGKITAVFDENTEAIKSVSLSRNLQRALDLSDKEMIELSEAVVATDTRGGCFQYCNNLYPGDENKKERRRCKWRCVGSALWDFIKDNKGEIAKAIKDIAEK